ncbi:ribonuclease H-like domain-containing protein [Tanacetum coccineum]
MDSDLRLTLVLRPYSSTRVETSTTTQKPIRIIPGLAVVEDVGEDDDFKHGSWVSAIEYVTANGGIVSGCLGDIKNFLINEKLDQVVAIGKSCTPTMLGDLTVTLNDLSGTIVGSIHHTVIDEGGYAKDIIVFYKDIVLGSGSGVVGSGMLDEEEIMKLLEEEEMVDLELQVCGNVNDDEDQYKLDEEALNLALEEEARAARAEQECLEKCRKEQKLDEEHER